MLQKLINIFSNPQNSETSDPCMLVFDPTKKNGWYMVQFVDKHDLFSAVPFFSVS